MENLTEEQRELLRRCLSYTKANANDLRCALGIEDDIEDEELEANIETLAAELGVEL